MIPTDPLFHKPKSIIATKNILYAVIFMDILILAIIGMTSGFGNYSKSPELFTSLIILIVVFILVKQIGFGRKWARLVFLVLFLLGVVFISFRIITLFNTNILIAVLFIFQILLQVLALRFLFSERSTIWFNSVRSTHPQ